MSRKDYQAAAALVRVHLEAHPEQDRQFVAACFARLFSDENPKFDRDRFYAACEVPDSKPMSAIDTPKERTA